MRRERSRLKQAVGLLLIVLGILVVWEVAKFIAGDPWRLNGEILGVQINFFHNPPMRWRLVTDQSLPHVWEIARTLTVPVQPNRPILASLLLDNALFTMRGAAIGFALGSAFGLLLGIVLAHVRLLERALVPYVVMSQTVPIIAVAPVIVIGLRAGWFSIALVAAYLTFFPVTIAALRGLRAADPRAIELMRSLAASRWAVL